MIKPDPLSPSQLKDPTQKPTRLHRVPFAALAAALLLAFLMALTLWAGEEAPTAPGAAWIRPRDGAVMVHVPAGPFLMGSGPEERMAFANERPQHTVDLDAFWIDQTEVTNARYQVCVAAGACQAPPPECLRHDWLKNPDGPVVCLRWQDAVDYASWVGGRLPTEAEWEKAARGTDGHLYPWGNGPPTCDNVDYSHCGELSLTVGAHPEGASPYGVLDMAGNVQEWVADYYGDAYYAVSPEQNPPGPDSGHDRVVRGGSTFEKLRYLRCAVRSSHTTNYGDEVVGFRVVVNAVPQGR